MIGGFLDADGSLPQSVLRENLATEFPFLDNEEVTQSIAAKINERFKEQYRGQSHPTTVSLSETETRALLAPAALAPEQELIVINALN